MPKFNPGEQQYSPFSNLHRLFHNPSEELSQLLQLIPGSEITGALAEPLGVAFIELSVISLGDKRPDIRTPVGAQQMLKLLELLMISYSSLFPHELPRYLREHYSVTITSGATLQNLAKIFATEDQGRIQLPICISFEPESTTAALQKLLPVSAEPLIQTFRETYIDSNGIRVEIYADPRRRKQISDVTLGQIINGFDFRLQAIAIAKHLSNGKVVKCRPLVVSDIPSTREKPYQIIISFGDPLASAQAMQTIAEEVDLQSRKYFSEPGNYLSHQFIAALLAFTSLLKSNGYIPLLFPH